MEKINVISRNTVKNALLLVLVGMNTIVNTGTDPQVQRRDGKVEGS